MWLKMCRRARGGHGDGSYITTYSKFPPEDRGTTNEVMWTFDVNYVTQNNSYVHLRASAIVT